MKRTVHDVPRETVLWCSQENSADSDESWLSKLRTLSEGTVDRKVAVLSNASSFHGGK
jgi:hypothetical protein